jgi:hypothetical protein
VSAGTRERADATRWSGTTELTIGLEEEEVMLVEPGPWSLHQDSDAVLASLDPGLRARASAETHASALELATGVHGDVAGAAGELAGRASALPPTSPRSTSPPRPRGCTPSPPGATPSCPRARATAPCGPRCTG